MFSLLSKIPGVSWVTGNFRLVIEYALIATVVTLAGVAVALWGGKKKTEVVLAQTETRLTGAEARMTTLESVNEAHEETIKELKDLRGQDAKALDGLLSDYKMLAEADSRVRTRLHNLETSNENVRNYLNLPVPAQLDCLLNDTCTPADKGSNKDRAGGPSSKSDR
jgi:cell division protein FtsB